MPTPEGAGPARRPTRYKRRLRSRIILSFLLLGMGLTLLLAVATNWARNRVEDQLVVDVMNKNIDEFARRYYSDPTRNPDVPVQQMLGRVVKPANFQALKQEQPEWYGLPDGIHTINGTNPDGSPFSYKLAVRKTPEAWFFLAYDMTQSKRGEKQFNNALIGVVAVFTALSLLVGWWAASRVMSPVTELAQR
ncbi:MAG TPA: two-component sensor histidine kinase, partial [Luteimonas sp.]|nr:two-component sensor histidine kinase [Luteimonas sp.]